MNIYGLLVICFILIVFLNWQSFKNPNKSKICFLTFNPSEQFYKFCQKLKYTHDVYICIDDNTYDIPNFKHDLTIIKIKEGEAESHGFKNSVKGYRRSTSRDKALYYFNDKKFEQLWLIEEDVFIPTINTIKNIDKKYTDSDLLCPTNDIVYNKPSNWHWPYIFTTDDLKLKPPYSSSMICAIRISKNMLNAIHQYSKQNKKLFLDEALFTTLALKNNLIVKNPKELKNIVWKHEWKRVNIKKNNLYHPVKSIKKQYCLRYGI
jgi:hypothetical protein